MNNSQNPLGWKIGIGTWFSVRVYVSVFFPLAAIYFCYEFGLPMGGLLSALLFVSVLLHEYGHIFGTRLTGGIGDEILVWPLGGLALVSPGNNYRAKIITAAAGPAVNLLICFLLLPFVWDSPHFRDAFVPWYAPITIEEFQSTPIFDNISVLGFQMNLVLLGLNLIPAWPLDGGQILRATLVESLGNTRGSDWTIKVTFAVSLIVLLGALIGDHSLVLMLGFFLFISGALEMQRMQMGEYYEESFMGYDFSQGYTSLERSEDKAPARQPGVIARWKAKRAAEKQKRLEIEARENEVQVDAILAKLHEHGMESLTEAEKRQLKRASSRYKGKDRNA